MEENLETKQEENNSSNRYILPASILLAAVLVAGSIIYAVGVLNSSGAKPTATNQNSGSVKEISSRDVVLGDPKAPVTLIEYGDYQCPFCGKFFNDSELLIRENYVKTGKVKMVFRNFQFLGAESLSVAQAAECAKDQGKFWVYHDAIYTIELKDGKENNGNLKRELFIDLAKSAGLDINVFTSCYDSGKYAAQVQKDTKDAQTLGVNSTPTTFVNGQEIQGAVPYLQFQMAIENALKASK